MKKLIFLLLLLNINNLYANGIIRFSESNSINKFGEYIVLTSHFSAPHMCHRGYLLFYNSNSHSWSIHKINAPILCVCPQDSNLWLGTYGKGIYKYHNGNTINFNILNTGEGNIHQQKNGLMSNYVNNIVADDSSIYCATEFGFSIYNYINNKWFSFDNTNSPLESPNLSDIFMSGNKIWMCSSNYYYAYYEHGDRNSERGNIACYDTKFKKWNIFKGARKSYDANDSTVILKGEIPLNNSNFENVLVDKSGRLWFSYFYGIGCYYHKKWTLFSEETTGIKFHKINDIAENNNGIWVATSIDGLYNYNIDKKKWMIYPSTSDKIPGKVITSIFATSNSLWIKSYGPGYWWGKEINTDTSRTVKIEEKLLFHKIEIDSDYVTIQCRDKDNWRAFYNPFYMEFLTIFENNKWQSWELTPMLFNEFIKD